MEIDHVSALSAPLRRDGKVVGHALWGDRVRVVQRDGDQAEVLLRGLGPGVRIAQSALGGQPLLELYFIDVGQGDGVLIKSPDGRHLLVDGGNPRARQNTGASAADFVDWKFVKDYGDTEIRLDALIATHNDLDHYGGLADLLDASSWAGQGLYAERVRVEAIYHAGLSWWKSASGDRTLGASSQQGANAYWTQLLGNRNSVLAALDGGAGPQLANEWARFWERALATRTAANRATPIRRLSQRSAALPGFSGGAGQLGIQVLGPVEERVGGKPALRRLAGGDSINTNGQSVMLRLDYGRCRVLLTGDLNREAQQALLQAYAGRETVFECDVAKACHHGSDDVSLRFLQAMRPAVTVISSGDNEGYDHPRPSIVAASAISGYVSSQDDALQTPLIYATELSRSIRLGRIKGLQLGGVDAKLADAKLLVEGRSRYQWAAGCRALSRLRYGLINVRSDGQRIVCATLSEKDQSWEIQQLAARF